MDLRWYQQEACEAVWNHLKLGQAAGNPVICLPTGAGKSLCIAELCRAAVQDYGGRVMVLAHRKELLEQNAAKVQALLPFPVGLHSAGLRRFSMDDDVIVAGIQSVFRKPEVFGRRHLCIIDEVHLVPKDGEGMYRTFLENLREVNPKLRLAGLTATPYRTGEGSVCSGDGMFQRIAYNAELRRLIGEGFLCELTSTVALASVDTSGLHIRAGEFIASETERLFGGDNVGRACGEIVAKCAGRKSVMVFCSGVGHAKDVSEKIESLSRERVGLVTGESSSLERGSALADFKAGRLRWLVNVDVLTTGFDAPCVDGIAVLRATASPGLFAQICGRGLRTFPGKADCLVLDFGENIKRHGPLDSPDYGKRSARRAAGFDRTDDEPGKVCPGCDEKVAPATKVCPCGFKFPVNHEGEAAADQVLAKPQKYRVTEINFARHKKRGGGPDNPDTLRVDYVCEPEEGGNMVEKISEWVCLEHPLGFARRKAIEWWGARCRVLPEVNDGLSIDEAISLWKCGAVAETLTITAVREGKFFWRVQSAELGPKPDQWEEPLPEMEEDAFAVEDLPF